MKATRTKIYRGLAGTMLAALFACCGAGLAQLTASAAEQLTRENASVFLPSTYEQYLELDKPQDVAVSDTHIAVADGNKIYLYTKDSGEWRTYAHGTESASKIGKIQLVDNLLYFTDAGMSLHTLDPDAEDFDVRNVGYSLTSFVVTDDMIYGTTATPTTASLYALELDGSTVIGETEPIIRIPSAELPMTYESGTLYYADSGFVYPIDTKTGERGTSLTLAKSTEPIRPDFICAAGTSMYFTEKTSGHLFVSDLDGTAECLDEGTGVYSALTLHEDKLYCVRGKAVREYSLSAKAFTTYEITSASDSVFRLDNACDTVRAGNLLVTADAGNSRVTIYNFATGEYSEVLPPENVVGAFQPSIVATDGTIIAVASGNFIYTCTYGEKYFTYRKTTLSGVRGLACVYGSVYYVTANAYGKLGEDDAFHDGFGTPDALAADVYGDLFVVYESSRMVVRFTESNFLSRGGGEKSFSLPAGYTSLRADFEGNLYYLVGNSLYRNGDKTPLTTAVGSDFVHTSGAGNPLSFALGFEDNEVFFLYGDYMVRTHRGTLDIPTLNEIDASGVRDEVFSEHGKENLLVDIPAGTIGIRTDLTELRENDPEYFPYSFYYRTGEDLRGILLAQKDEYALVVLYETYEDDRVFTANLFRLDPEESGALVDESEYWTESGSQQYISSPVSAYFFPCLPEALQNEALARGTRVTVLGTVAAPERDYCLVEYQTAARSASRGFVPKAYLTEIDPSGDGGAEYLLGKLKPQKEAVVFTSEDGDQIELMGGESVRLYDNGDGTYTARITKDGKTYSAKVEKSMIEWGENDALRIALIVILTVIALLIIGVYVYFLPRDSKKKKRK